MLLTSALPEVNRTLGKASTPKTSQTLNKGRRQAVPWPGHGGARAVQVHELRAGSGGGLLHGVEVDVRVAGVALLDDRQADGAEHRCGGRACSVPGERWHGTRDGSTVSSRVTRWVVCCVRRARDRCVKTNAPTKRTFFAFNARHQRIKCKKSGIMYTGLWQPPPLPPWATGGKWIDAHQCDRCLTGRVAGSAPGAKAAFRSSTVVPSGTGCTLTALLGPRGLGWGMPLVAVGSQPEPVSSRVPTGAMNKMGTEANASGSRMFGLHRMGGGRRRILSFSATPFTPEFPRWCDVDCEKDIREARYNQSLSKNHCRCGKM